MGKNRRAIYLERKSRRQDKDKINFGVRADHTISVQRHSIGGYASRSPRK